MSWPSPLVLVTTRRGILILLVTTSAVLGAGFGIVGPTLERMLDDSAGSTVDGETMVSSTGSPSTGNDGTNGTGPAETDNDTSPPSTTSPTTRTRSPTPTATRTPTDTPDPEPELSVTGGDGRSGFLVSVDNAAPGQRRRATTRLANVGEDDGRLSIGLTAIRTVENALIEPEREAGDTTADRAELDDHLRLRIALVDDRRRYLVGGPGRFVRVRDLEPGPLGATDLSEDESTRLVVDWWLPAGTDDRVQSDSAVFEFAVTLTD